MSGIPESVNEARLAAMEAGDRLVALGTTSSGLTAAEVSWRLALYGHKEPVVANCTFPLKALATRFAHTLALLLWCATGLAFAAGIPERGGAIGDIVPAGCVLLVRECRVWMT